MIKKISFIATLILVQTCTLFAQQQVFDTKRMVLTPFEYNEVKLQNSPLSRQFKEVENYYLAISNDDLLKGFRERAGLPTNGAKNLGGWYSNDLFHIFGQLLSGMSRLYAVSGNEALKTKVTTLINEWSKTIDKDGYFFYSKKPNARHYVYEKMVGGLVDAHLFTDNKQALLQLDIISDWAIKNLTRERIYGQTQSEWYTLSENLYRAYQVTKDEKYRDFGKVWEYPEYWNSYLNGTPPIEKTRHHGYSHLNTLSSAAAAYLTSGDKKYEEIIKNAYDFFTNTQTFATGGFGPNERLLPTDKLVEALRSTHNSFETQCGSWAIFKFSKYLMEITGDAKYGDWIEKMTINGIGANIPMSGDGKVLYYSDYNPRQGTKHNYHLGWSCCVGTRPQAVAEYADLVYFKGADGLYVNLYTPSKINWNGLSVNQTTSYPETNHTEFDITSNTLGKKVVLAFRHPSWAKQTPVIWVNGKVVSPVIANNWLKIDRVWKKGDKVKMVFPMNLYADRLDDSLQFPTAIMYGPVAMAVNVTDHYPSVIADENNLSAIFSQLPGSPLTFKVKNYPDLTLRPYYQFAAEEPYILYIDPAVKNFVPEKNLLFKGNWQKAKGPYFSNDKNASVSTNFTGTGIVILISGLRNSGKMKVEIDGKQVDLIDTYHPKEGELQTEKIYNNLYNGQHIVTVSVTGEKNPDSKDSFINFSRFKVIE
ncbi:MAG TPA: beta-L-arabinofuranosidase domain-containing protein [Sphingobacteriaceae bacterium]|nr:beta-L-arabinofuranosidase domain-containing protein [Sphingobacteriaceae bacterium]